ncbi:MAG: hypothetical protein WC339_05275 [Candidatus Izemoplasmatales bacterium]|jgi:hypothetical protein|nr:hypothetical protein [Candidatus Izemoplasmatales bacterium]
MDWYWYVLIGVGVVGLGILKLSVFNKIKAKKHHHDDSEEQD